MTKHEISTGQILLAEPFMQDVNFKRAAVLLCDHGEGGSVGFILNKELDMKIDELVADFPSFDSQAYFGGPVQTDTIHYIHNKGDILEDSTEITKGIFWGGNFDQLKALINSELILPGDIRFFVGYSGWSEGQLAEEMQWGSWVSANMHANYIFKSKPSGLWREIMNRKGRNYTVIAQMPDGLSLN